MGKVKHNQSHSRLYSVYHSMKQRCLYSKHKEYYRYGGRGITICLEWMNDFVNFYNWSINNGYDDNLTLDRINPNGNYEPSNCRYITISKQQQTRSNCKFYTLNGETHNLTEWAIIYNINPKTVMDRVYHKWDIYKALTTPIDLSRLNFKYRKQA